MAKIDNIKRIIRDDFKKEDQELIGRLSYVINSFMEQTIRQINGNLDFTNLAQDQISFSMVVDSGGVPIGNNLVSSEIQSPSGLLVVGARNVTDSSVYPTNAPFISFVPTSNNTKVLKIQKISGLQADNKYDLTVLVIP